MLSFGSATHPGALRAVNEDSVLAEPPIFVVADGMGGHAYGDVASRLAVDHFRPLIGRAAVSVEEIRTTLTEANTEIRRVASLRPGHTGMGTTVAGLALTRDDGSAYWLAFNLGDSRLYRSYGGALRQVSVDHSHVQELIEAGEIRSSQAATHPERHVVTRSLGGTPVCDPDYWLVPMIAGERFLICSDGLTTELTDIQIADTLRRCDSAADAADRLVMSAVRAGGRDNVSVIVLDVPASAGALPPAETPTADESTVPRRRSIDND